MMFEANNNLYKTVSDEYPDITLHDVHGLTIPFSDKWKTIGMNLSGGADSACLTMLLAGIIEDNNYNCKIQVISHCRCWTTRPWQLPISINVYNKLKEKWPNIIGLRVENYIPPEIEMGALGFISNNTSGDMFEVSSFNGYIGYRDKLDAIFNATTKVPSGDDVENIIKKNNVNLPPKRSFAAEEGKMRDVIHFGSEIFYTCHPFRFIEKDVIISFYHLYNNTDILDTTRSCEGDILDDRIKKVMPSVDAYFNSDAEVPTCNKCFWCIEREWAISSKDKCIEKIKQI
jgi:hypothetical protein